MKRRDFLKIIAVSPLNKMLLSYIPAEHKISPEVLRRREEINERFDNLIALSGYIRHHGFWFYAHKHNSFIQWCNVKSKWLTYGNRHNGYPQPDASWWMQNVSLDSHDRDNFVRWEKHEDKLFWCGRFRKWQLEPEPNSQLAEKYGEMNFDIIETKKEYWEYKPKE